MRYKYKVIQSDGMEYVFSTLKKAKEYIAKENKIYHWRIYKVEPLTKGR